MSGPFASKAVEYAELGLHPFPLSEEDGKTPRFKGWNKTKRGPVIVSQLARRFPNANIGIPTGPMTRITVIDCDTPDYAGEMLDRCGQTSLIVQTAKGHHLYYRYSGERSEVGILGPGTVDIRGLNGQVAALPSIHKTGVEYEIATGDFRLLADLPPIKEGGLPTNQKLAANSNALAFDGRRNEELFLYCRQIAWECQNEDELIERALVFAGQCEPVYPEMGARGTALKVWEYREAGTVYVPGGGGYTLVDDWQFDALHGLPDAYYVFSDLCREHRGLRSEFKVGLRGYSERVGLSQYKLRKALKGAVERGVLVCVHPGGNGPNDPGIYKFAPRSEVLNDPKLARPPFSG